MNSISLTSIRPAPVSWVEKLFDRMQSLYGNKFIDMWRDTNIDLVKHLWGEEMGKLSAEDLRRGYSSLMARDWPPTLPEFVKLCKPSIDPTVAYYEALNGIQSRERGEVGTWSHPAIFWAAVVVSAHDLKHQSYSQVKARWEKALRDEFEKGEWAAVPEPLIALPEPGKSFLSREKATQMVEELKATDAVKAIDSKVDHKLWAKRILERKKKGDKNLMPIQVSFAREALASKAN
jgi:hypothetical protein